MPTILKLNELNKPNKPKELNEPKNHLFYVKLEVAGLGTTKWDIITTEARQSYTPSSTTPDCFIAPVRHGFS